MKSVILFLLFSLSIRCGTSQTVIKLTRAGGVSMIPCKINSLPLNFIFDTGASDVSISLTEARFMFKNGYLKTEDIIGTQNYSIANGDIVEGVIINLKTIEIGNLILKDVKASISNSITAPLLLGQSAILKLGIIQLDLAKNELIILNNTNSSTLPKKANTVVNSLSIGSSAYGGFVALLFDPEDEGYVFGEQHGFVISKTNISNQDGAPWSSNYNSYGTSLDFGQGYANTKTIITNDTNANIASRLCAKYKIGNYKDWYLPSYSELSLIFDNANSIPGLIGGNYWTSSEFQIDEAVIIKLSSNVSWEHVDKFRLAQVRAIRRF
jgi:clan AA aspartic protease (TIGR02281 family)